MTAPFRRIPRAARAQRAARQAPPGRGVVRQRVAAPTAAIPPVEVRRRRGPKPPDHVVAALERALRAAADPDSGVVVLGAAWERAMVLALGAISRAARRGVLAALAGTGAVARARALPAPVPPADWFHQLTGSVRAALAEARADAVPAAHTDASIIERLKAALAAAVRAIANAVFGEHTRQVQVIARGAGADRYVWTTQLDDRVRALHVELEGTVQHWNAPPLAGLPDFHGHPGEAAGPCRCVAWPLL
jgi:hypothetical protein